MRDFFVGIGIFFEDQLAGLLVGLAFGAGVLLAILLLTGSLDDADCSAEVEAAEAALVGEMLEAIGPEIIQMSLQIMSLQEQLAAAEAQSNGPSGDSGIRPNEELGAYSDAAGEFYCFPTEGAGFPSG